MGVALLLLIVSMAVILIAAELFTNSVEWLGHKLGLGEGAVGSILAAVGTAMPETMIPIIAILFTGTEAGHEVGIGAILGAPFMLSTAAFFVTGAAVFIFAAQNRRTREMRVNVTILERDIRFFLIVYVVAVACSFIPAQPIKILAGALLVGLYAYYVWRTLKAESDVEKIEAAVENDLSPLRFSPHADDPRLALVIVQILFSLGVMVGGAHIFVQNVEVVAHEIGIPALVLSLVLAPLATELPEKFNSVVWVRNWKDTLALGNITGAMVFQSCIPVAVGLWMTPWVLDTPGLVSAGVALVSTAIVYSMIVTRKKLTPGVLLVGGLMYVAFIVYVVTLSGAAAAH